MKLPQFYTSIFYALGLLLLTPEQEVPDDEESSG